MENLGLKTAHWFTKESRTNEGKRLVYTTSVKDVVKVLDFIKSGGPEFTARDVREWFGRSGGQDPVRWTRVAVGERVLGELQGQAERNCSIGVFFALLEVQILAEQYRQVYNRARPLSSLAYRAPEAVVSSVPVPLLTRLTCTLCQGPLRVRTASLYRRSTPYQYPAFIPHLDGAGVD